MVSSEDQRKKSKLWSKSGFTTVWLVMILSSLIFLLLVIVEASSGFVCGSICENVCVSAGQSVLSEFNSALYENYGVLAIRANDTRLANMASYYIGSSLASEKCIVKPKLENCTVFTESYPALGTELFEAQIKALGTQTGIYSITSENSLIQAFSELFEASEYAQSMDVSSIGRLQNFMENSSDKAGSLHNDASDLADSLAELVSSEEYDETEAEALSDDIEKLENEADEADHEAKICRNLISSYNSAIDPDFESEGQNKSIPDAVCDELPSSILETSETLSLILSGGLTEPDIDAIPCGEYILNNCSDFQNRLENTVLNGETEYILYGHKNENDNLSAVKRSLFTLRFPLNLKEIYADPEKMAEFNASAAAFLPVPVSLTVFVLASIDASAKSLNDIEQLCSRHSVPFIKGGKGGDYSDYLRILLLCLPQNVKMVRLMDVIQMNLNEINGEAFNFRDFCYGFNLSAEFKKNLKVSIVSIPSARKGLVNISTSYQ